MKRIDRDPELFDDPEEGVGEEVEVELPDYDESRFELPDDYEWVETDEGDEHGENE
jgi:hypothetical protein